MIEETSDPLPYSQFDRAAKPIAAALADHLKISFPHAKGALSEFWDRCGDPRELESLLARGERQVVLTGAQVVLRFRIASAGCDIHPDVLVEVRVLERLGPDSYRVRGMSSRYFKVIERRLQARAAASVGGKASAKARAERFGTAQPRSGAGSESASEPLREPLRENPQAPTFSLEATPEATPKRHRSSGQRTADSGQDRSDRSVKPNANAVWAELVTTFEHYNLPAPEIHPRERNDRIQTLLKQLPRPDPVLLDQVLFVALKHHETLRGAGNPLAYLQKMLKDPDTLQSLLEAVEAERPAA